jgi:replication factor A1
MVSPYSWIVVQVTENGQGGWFCEKCNKAYPTNLPRYIFNFGVGDATGTQWISVFNEVREAVYYGHVIIAR